MLSRLRGLLWALETLVPSSRLTAGAKLDVLLQVLRTAPGGGDSRVGIPLEGGTLQIDPHHRPDWRVFRGVFNQPTYATDFAGAAVVDVGAHRGLFSVWALQHGCRALVAYEPEAVNFSFLERNAASFLGDRQAVRVHRQAVGGHTGMLRLHVYEESWSHSAIERPDKRAVASVEVEQVTLETAVEEVFALGPECRRLVVKIDAEGAEHDILYAAPRAVLDRIDELFIEIHDFAPGAADDLTRYLGEAGLHPAAGYDLEAGPHTLDRFVRTA